VERIAYLNGSFVKESEATISVFDRGFIHGDAAFDALRTFRHVPFRVNNYLDRFFRSLRYMQIRSPLSREEWQGVITELIERNLPMMGEDDDSTIMLRITRGSSLKDILDCGPTNYLAVCKPIPFQTFARQYREGIHVIVPTRRRIPAESVSPLAKNHNRLNLTLAELEAKMLDPQALPLLLDPSGNVSESSAMNFFMVQDGALLTPTGNCLDGITRKTIVEMVEDMEIEAREENFDMYALYNADEAFLCSTTPVILPIAKINGRGVGEQVPGPITRKLCEAWSRLVGVDFVAQAERHVRA